MSSTNPSSSNSGQGLKRVLGLSSLVLYGIIIIQPTAPMPLYGAVADLGHGHVVSTVLVGMVAMMFTAISYGRMANAYPNAGSAYTYVGREIHPGLGYIAGWSMLFDYVMNPTICIIWTSKAAMNLIPEIPFGFYAVFFTVLFTTMNLRGIKASSRTNFFIATGLGIVIVLFLGAAARFLFLHPPAALADWTRPFYNPETFTLSSFSAGASIAVLTYFGFDGISTLSEEVHNPRRNIMLASVLVCIITGVLASIQVYMAQLVWPGTSFPDQDTAFCFVAGKAGGQWLFYTVNVAVLVGTVGAGSGAHLGAGRLLYAMGRDNAIPAKFFGVVNPRTRIPSNNIILVGALALAGAFLITFSLGAQLVNFGALIAFMGVNASSFVRYFLRNEKKTFSHLIVPVLGFTICLYLWLSLGYKAKIAGLCWLTTGVLYGAYRTSWFRKRLNFALIEDNNESEKA
jgi:putrescine importer